VTRDDTISQQYLGLAFAMFGTVALIVYGTLYPFRFALPGELTLADTWRALAFRPSSRGDLVANVLLYAPFGGLLTLVLARKPNHWPPATPSRRASSLLLNGLLVAGAALALSVCLECIQTVAPQRVASLTDVAMNVIGAACGIVAAAAYLSHGWQPGRIGWSAEPGSLVALSAVGLWVLAASLPWVPTLDLQKYKDALKPLVDSQRLDGTRVFGEFAGWLVVAFALLEIVGRARQLYVLLAVLSVTLVAQVVIVDNRLTPEELLGAALASALVAFPQKWPPRLAATCLAALLAAAYIADGLTPFTFSPIPSPFGWIPFLGTLESGSPLGVAASWLEKLFAFVALAWLLRRASASIRASIAVVGFLVLGVEILQRYVPGRTAEITDPIVAVATTALLLNLQHAVRVPGAASR